MWLSVSSDDKLLGIKESAAVIVLQILDADPDPRFLFKQVHLQT